MHLAQGFHHFVWVRAHWKLSGIVGASAIYATSYGVLTAVWNKTVNSKILILMRERAVPMSEQEISSRLNIPLARIQQRMDSLFGRGEIEQVSCLHWQDRAGRGWRLGDRRAA